MSNPQVSPCFSTVHLISRGGFDSDIFALDETKTFSGTLTVTSYRAETATVPARVEGTFTCSGTFTGFSRTAQREISFPAVITNGKFAIGF